MLIQQPLFEHRMTRNPILFEAFWNSEEQREVCEGFVMSVNWSPADPLDIEVFYRMDYLTKNYTLGIYLERKPGVRKIHLGNVGSPCYDPVEHKSVISLAEIELHSENTPAFDWLVDSIEDEEPEDEVYFSWPQVDVRLYEPYEFAATMPDGRIYDEMRTFCRAGATIRFFVQTLGQQALAS